MAQVKTARKLGEALRDREDWIEIEGDLARLAFRIRATGTVAWFLACGCIAAAVIFLPSGAATLAAVPIGSGAVLVLGASGAMAAASIAVGAGSVDALNRLREYREVSRSPGRLVLSRS